MTSNHHHFSSSTPEEELRCDDNRIDCVLTRYGSDPELRCKAERRPLCLEQLDNEEIIACTLWLGKEWFQIKEELVELTIALDDNDDSCVMFEGVEEMETTDDTPSEI